MYPSVCTEQDVYEDTLASLQASYYLLSLMFSVGIVCSLLPGQVSIWTLLGLTFFGVIHLIMMIAIGLGYDGPNSIGREFAFSAFWPISLSYIIARHIKKLRKQVVTT